MDNQYIFPVSEEFFEKAIEFNQNNKKQIEEIKNIFLENLNEYEKNNLKKIINNNNYNKNENNEDIQIIDDYNIENTIKEYISISMIRTKNNRSSDLYDIILFIPTDDDNVKSKINEYVNKNNKEFINDIIYGTINIYRIPSDIEEII